MSGEGLRAWPVVLVLLWFAAFPVIWAKEAPTEEQGLDEIRAIYAAGEYRKCIIFCQDFLRTHRNHPEALQYSGLSALKLFAQEPEGPHLERALDIAKKMLAKPETSARGHLLLGHIYSGLKVCPLAAPEYREALRLDAALSEAETALEELRAAGLEQFKVVDDFFRAPYRVKVYSSLGTRPAGTEYPQYYFVFFKDRLYVQHNEVLAKDGKLIRVVERSASVPEPRPLCSLEDLVFLHQVKDRLTAIQQAKFSYEEGRAAVARLAEVAPEAEFPMLVEVTDLFEKACLSAPEILAYRLALLDAYMRLCTFENVPARIRGYILGSALSLAPALLGRKDLRDQNRQEVREHLAYVYYYLHAVPLCLETLRECPQTPKTQVLRKALKTLHQDAFEKESAAQAPELAELLVYRCTASPPESGILFDERVFVVQSRERGDLAVYTLASQPLAGKRRYYLFEYLYGQAELVNLYGETKPEPEAVQTVVMAFVKQRFPESRDDRRQAWLLERTEADLRALARALNELESERKIQ